MLGLFDLNIFDLNREEKNAIGLSFVFEKLNCHSPYGVEKFKQITPFGSDDSDSLNECFDVMEKLKNFDKIAIYEICNLLKHFKNIRGIADKLQSEALNQVELFEIKSFLLTFEKFLPLFEIANEKIQLISIVFIPMTEVLNILDPQKKRLLPFSIESEFSHKITSIRREKSKIEALLQKESDKKCREDLIAKRAKIVAEEDSEEARIMEELSEKIRNNIEDFSDNIDNIGKLDFAIAKTLLASEYNAIRPKIGGQKLLLKNMQNPMIAEILAMKGKKITKVSMELTTGTTIITGANMGGKSVAMRTAMLNVTLCRLGFFVFADEAEIPMFSKTFLISDDMQDTRQGLSSFGAEIVKLNDITKASSSGEFLFIVLDELARATNPHEGTAIVKAVAKYFSSKNCICLMSTHYDGVISEGMKHYQVAGFSTNITSTNNIYECMNYNLVEVDITATLPRDALRICKLLGMDESLLDMIKHFAFH